MFKDRDVPPQERLAFMQKVINLGKVTLDTIGRGLPCFAGMPPNESQFHNFQQEIAQLETIANDPHEHTKE